MILTNAQIVLANEVIKGTLVVQDGVITHLDQGHISLGHASLNNAIDCQNAYLTAGMIELHTDNMEKHFTPRPGVTWPAIQAFKVHDAQMVSAGITSVFDAISVGDVIEGSERLNNLSRMVDALNESRERGLTRADHFLHLRCEVSHQDTLANFQALLSQTSVQLVSVMDHSPGQRQFAKMDKYREYYQGKYKLSEAEMDAFIRRQLDASLRFSAPFRESICATCEALHIPLASHDDATLEHVEESHHFNMKIAEFPTTAQAAKAAHEKGMSVLMGAPNVVRGGSHSGNIAAHELASAGVLDILSSDYYPASLLESAFNIAQREDNHYDLPQAINLVSLNPARAVGLEDRGQIALGQKADLIWSAIEEDHVHIKQVWKNGLRAF